MENNQQERWEKEFKHDGCNNPDCHTEHGRKGEGWEKEFGEMWDDQAFGGMAKYEAIDFIRQLLEKEREECARKHNSGRKMFEAGRAALAEEVRRKIAQTAGALLALLSWLDNQ